MVRPLIKICNLGTPITAILNEGKLEKCTRGLRFDEIEKGEYVVTDTTHWGTYETTQGLNVVKRYLPQQGTVFVGQVVTEPSFRACPKGNGEGTISFKERLETGYYRWAGVQWMFARDPDIQNTP